MSAICAPRSLLGIVLGIALGIPVTFVTENNMLGVVLGSVAAATVAGLQEVKTAITVGSFTGARALSGSPGPTFLRRPMGTCGSAGHVGPPPSRRHRLRAGRRPLQLLDRQAEASLRRGARPALLSQFRDRGGRASERGHSCRAGGSPARAESAVARSSRHRRVVGTRRGARSRPILRSEQPG